MSLRGRFLIDKIKATVSHRFTLPCPPYGLPTYWDGVYEKLGPSDVYEWGSTSLTNLLQHQYDPTLFAREMRHVSLGERSSTSDLHKESDANPDASGHQLDPTVQTTSFGEAIGVHQQEEARREILLLGCGNSKMGEDMIRAGWAGPIIQVDVSQRVVNTMAERCSQYVSDGLMSIVHDDATSLTAFEDGTIHACIDKGLIDALFCATRPDQIQDVIKNVNRILVPGGVFCFFSFSRPEFLLDQLLNDPTRSMDKKRSSLVDHSKRKWSNHKYQKDSKSWDDVQVRALDSILMYRFVKSVASPEMEDRLEKAGRLKRKQIQRRRQQ